jgi:hypothetical protein
MLDRQPDAPVAASGEHAAGHEHALRVIAHDAVELRSLHHVPHRHRREMLPRQHEFERILRKRREQNAGDAARAQNFAEPPAGHAM